MKTYIKGNYRKSIYESDKGYVIGLFKVRDTNDEDLKIYVNKTLTFTGYFHELNEDDIYVFYGEGVENPRYGFQFQVSEYERLKPDDVEGLVAFLSSDLFKGVGPSLAQSIVDTLGQDALNMILNDASCLLMVPKMTQKKADKIFETLSKYEESHQMIVYLTDLGFSMKDALSIYNAYKKETISKLEYNPYLLVEDADISFTKVDEIALKQNMDMQDERRMKACIIYCMKKRTFAQSDTYLTYEEIRESVQSYIKEAIDYEYLSSLMSELVSDDKVILEENRYYLKDLWQAEDYIVQTLKRLINKEPVNYRKLDNYLDTEEKESGITYNDKQKEAIVTALKNSVSIITGGPGTGKTTIIKAICNLYMELNHLNFEEAMEQIALLAPTGRASKRMSESTLLPASTIHRFLKWNKETNDFAVNEYEPDFHRFIIVDEVSMIDTELLSNLLKGLTRNIQIVLVGDHNQLPSVGPGQVLKDLIESDMIPVITLDHLYRQDENSYINALAYEIKDDDLSENFLETRSDYTFLRCDSFSIIEQMKKLSEQLIQKDYDYKRVQMMAPMYAGINGIDHLNQELQKIFNPEDSLKNELKINDVIFREQDKVLQLVNMPENNVYNGDIGIIKSITKVDKKTLVYVDFDGNLVEYASKDLNKLKHGYVISIHKSQGSEFELVVLPICHSYQRMLYRKLIYTAVTRAKRKLILIGEPQSFVYSVHHQEEMVRKTTLKEKLVNNILNS